MLITDIQSHPLGSAIGVTVDAVEQAGHEFGCVVADPLAGAQHAAALSPNMPMAHVLVAWLNLLGTDPAGIGSQLLCCARHLALGGVAGGD